MAEGALSTKTTVMSFLKCVCVTTITRKALSRLVVTAQRITDKMTSNLHRAFLFDYSNRRVDIMEHFNKSP